MDRNYEQHDLTERPDRETIELFRRTPPTFVSDFLKQIGIVNHTIKRVRPLQPFPEYKNHMAGPAITMYLAPVNESSKYLDAPYLHTEIVERGQEGDVLVIAGSGAPYGFWGDHTTHQAVNQRLSGVVVDGFVRDSRPSRETGLPIFCLGVTPESYVRRYDPVGYNIPVSCCEAQVAPGDLIVGDDDGVVVIPKALIGRVAEGVHGIMEAEDELRGAVANGVPWQRIYQDIHARKYLEERAGR